MSPDTQLLISLGALLVSAASLGWTVLVWNSGRAKASRDELRGLHERLIRAESEIEDKPTAKALHELALAISHFGGDLKAVVARLDGMTELVKRLEKVADRQEQYLLNDKGGR